MAAAALVLAAPAANAADVLRAAYEDRALPPYYMNTSTEVDANAPGVSIELVREAAAELGMTVEFTRMPWVRCLKSLKQGEVDLVFNASFKADRLEDGVYPMAEGKPDAARRIATVSYALYRLKGSQVSWNGKTVTGLEGPVGAPSGYSILEDLKSWGVPTEEAADATINFKKLASRRIQAIALLEVSGDSLIKDYPAVEKVAPPLAIKDYFAIFSHQFYDAKRDTAEKFWRKLAEVRDRKAPALYAKYAR
jgi:polar amino acid transport system substrate-binding protein